MKLSKFTLSDDIEAFEGYTDGSLWDGWVNVCFTREQVIEFLKTTPYDFRFDVNKADNIPVLLVYWETNNAEIYFSSPLPLDNGDIIEGYFLDGLEFMEVEQ